jgi:hypothetical protein
VGTAISNAAFNPTEYRGLIAFRQPYEISTTSYILPHCDARPTMYRFATDAPIDLDEFRARLRKMTDAQLLRYGKAARYMRSPTAYFGKAPRETFVIQLWECRVEWKRRSVMQTPFEHDATNGRCVRGRTG